MLYKGKIVHIFAEKSDGWVSFILKCDDGRKISTSGISVYPLSDGYPIEVEGEEVFHPKYGYQIKASKITLLDKGHFAEDFLAQYVSGIGKKTAKKIVKTLGSNAIEKIIKDPSILLTVNGITPKKFKKMANSFADSADILESIDILDYFSGKITMNKIEKIRQYLSNSGSTFNDIKKNPYILIKKIEGFGFKTIDKLGLAAGIEEYSTNRIEAAIVCVLQELSYSEGHVYSNIEQLKIKVSELLIEINPCLSKKTRKELSKLRAYPYSKINIPKELEKYSEELSEKFVRLYDIIDSILDKQNDDIIVDDDRIYWVALYKAECGIANFVKFKKTTKTRMINNIEITIDDYENDKDVQLSNEQKLAIKTALNNSFSIITGGPGRGKSTIVDAIVNIWNDDENLILLAPTGKAAQRLSSITGKKASTIHMFINSKNEYSNNALCIVDEASMIGDSLFYSFIKTLSPKMKLILIGDIDQLASIEPGNLLRDLINSNEVPTTKLTKGFRNMGSIAKNADVVNNMGSFSGLIWDKDSEFIEADSVNMLNTIKIVYEKELENYNKENILLLSPMRNIGLGSVNNINNLLSNYNYRKTHPSHSLYSTDKEIRIGDRVIQTVNNYNRIFFYIDKYGERIETCKQNKGIFNGDLGTITYVDKEENIFTVRFDLGYEADYSINEFGNEIILAYAITVHKSQGSEAECVICVVSNQHSYLLNKNLFYTGITRAKKKLIIIGDKKTITLTCKKEDVSKRNTYLKERITVN